MKRKIFTLITLLSLCCLSACATETKDNVATGNKNDVAVENVDNEPTAKPVVEATTEPTTEPISEVAEATAEPTPTEEPVVEATPEPTEVPKVVYEGIDMESDLLGEDWIETFVGIIDEPKVIIFSDITNRKEIIEEGAIVMTNPSEDMIALYIPDGYKEAKKKMGIQTDYGIDKEHSIIWVLDVENTIEKGVQMAALYAEKDGEEIAINFTLVPEE